MYYEKTAEYDRQCAEILNGDYASIVNCQSLLIVLFFFTV